MDKALTLNIVSPFLYIDTMEGNEQYIIYYKVKTSNI